MEAKQLHIHMRIDRSGIIAHALSLYRVMSTMFSFMNRCSFLESLLLTPEKKTIKVFLFLRILLLEGRSDPHFLRQIFCFCRKETLLPLI